MGCMADIDTRFAAIVAAEENLHLEDDMRFALPDGKVVSGRGYTDIVRAMADEKFTPPKNLSKYREALADRAEAMYGTRPDTGSDRSFVTSLVKVGLLIKVK